MFFVRETTEVVERVSESTYLYHHGINWKIGSKYCLCSTYHFENIITSMFTENIVLFLYFETHRTHFPDEQTNVFYSAAQ